MKKLNSQEYSASLYSLKQLDFNCNIDTSISFRNVEVVDKVTDNVIFNIQVPVNISPEIKSYKINIVLKNAGFMDFRSLQLSGVHINKMSYDEINE